MRAEVLYLYQLHDSPLSGGHFAADKTLSRIKQRFWRPGILQHVRVARRDQRLEKVEKLTDKQLKQKRRFVLLPQILWDP